jgi:hypothetical protein
MGVQADDPPPIGMVACPEKKLKNSQRYIFPPRSGSLEQVQQKINPCRKSSYRSGE